MLILLRILSINFNCKFTNLRYWLWFSTWHNILDWLIFRFCYHFQNNKSKIFYDFLWDFYSVFLFLEKIARFSDSYSDFWDCLFHIYYSSVKIFKNGEFSGQCLGFGRTGNFTQWILCQPNFKYEKTWNWTGLDMFLDLENIKPI